MSIPNNYGRLWGQIPNTAGQVHWVAPAASYTVNGQAYSASDNNDGLDPSRALLTIGQAWTNATASAGDVIVLLPGTHSPSASIAASKAGVTMMGLPSGEGNYLQQKTTIGAVTGDQNMNITAADIEIAYLNFIPVTTDTAIDLTNAADRCHIHHCSFDLFTPAVNTGTKAIECISGPSRILIDHCYFESDGSQGAAIDATASIQSVIEHCTFLVTGTTAWTGAIVTGAGTTGLTIRDCDFPAIITSAHTSPINGTAATIASGVHVYRCIFGSLTTTSKPLDGFSAGEAEIAEVYVAGVGSCDGGALVVVTT